MLNFVNGGFLSDAKDDAGFTRKDVAYSGVIGPITITASVVAGDALTYNSTDEGYEPADAAGAINVQAIALEIVTVGTGETGVVQALFMGYIRNISWAFDVGASVYSAEVDETEGYEVPAGAVTKTAPVTQGSYVQHLGYAVSATGMFFNPAAAAIVT